MSKKCINIHYKSYIYANIRLIQSSGPIFKFKWGIYEFVTNNIKFLFPIELAVLIW